MGTAINTFGCRAGMLTASSQEVQAKSVEENQVVAYLTTVIAMLEESPHLPRSIYNQNLTGSSKLAPKVLNRTLIEKKSLRRRGVGKRSL